MNIDMFIIGVLVVLLLGTNVFWAKMVLDLTNRIMSRSYFEVLQAEKQKQEAPRILLKEDNEVDLYAQEQASKLNSLIGVV